MTDQDETSDIRTILERWLPSTQKTNKDNIYWSILTYLQLMIPDYLKQIQPIHSFLITRETKEYYEMISSGCLCFFGMILLGLSNLKGELPIHNIGNFVTLYLMVDYFLDDPKINQENKATLVRNITNIINETLLLEDIPENDTVTRKLYSYLSPLMKSSLIRRAMLKLLSVEVDSVKIQSKSSFSRQVYMDIAKRKGGITLQTIGVILGYAPRERQEDFDLGICIQIVDDILDIDDDIKDEIHTIATTMLQEDHYLDELALYVARQIDLLKVNSLFKISLLALLTHGIQRLPYFSLAMKNITIEYNWLPEDKLSEVLGRYMANFLV